jgi:hypothetical protein
MLIKHQYQTTHFRRHGVKGQHITRRADQSAQAASFPSGSNSHLLGAKILVRLWVLLLYFLFAILATP